MIALSLAIGDELLRGEIVDGNSAYLGAALLRAGLRLAGTRELGDDEDEIVAALRDAVRHAAVVVVSGGLGPTSDDRTAAAAARAFDRPLELHAPSLERMRALFASRGYTLTPNNEKQAWVPRGADVIENPVGTAPAFALREGETDLFFLPGVPREYRRILDDVVIPRVRARRPDVAVCARVLHTLGATESRVDSLLRDLDLAALGKLNLHFRVEGPETHVILVGEGADAANAEATLARAEAAVRERLGSLVYGHDAQTIANILGAALVAKNATIAIAESCTAGLVAAELTNVPGSSRYFRTGVIAYANETKTALLGVSPETLREHGAVSEAAARAMAQGIRALAKSDVGVAVTGIAGPDGGTAEKPVGLVHFAATGARDVHRRVLLPPGRERVRAFAARIALHVALEALG